MSYKMNGYVYNDNMTSCEKEKKELTPLEALERIKIAPTIYVGCASDIYTRYSQECKIIEAALKEYEKPKKIVESISFEQSMENYVKNNCPSIAKKLKALEIIKEKTLTINDLYWLKNGDYREYRKNLETLYYGVEEEHLQKILKTQEEFDLLKEVLND